MTTDKPATVDDYLEGVPSDAARKSLFRLREIIREEVPEATEVISYGIPTYKFNKTMLSFAAFKGHCSIFPGYTVREFTDQLAGFKMSKGTIQFSPDRPIPEPLVRAIIKARFRPGG